MELLNCLTVQRLHQLLSFVRASAHLTFLAGKSQIRSIAIQSLFKSAQIRWVGIFSLYRSVHIALDFLGRDLFSIYGSNLDRQLCDMVTLWRVFHGVFQAHWYAFIRILCLLLLLFCIGLVVWYLSLEDVLLLWTHIKCAHAWDFL